jgi:hypothetical protein
MKVLQWSSPRGVKLVINQLTIPVVLEASPDDRFIVYDMM